MTYTHFFIPFFIFPGEYDKVNIIIYWIEVMLFVGLRESIIGNFQTRQSTGDIAQLLRDLQTFFTVSKSRKSWALSPVLCIV